MIYGNILYKWLWHDKGTFKRLLYIFIPFILLAVFIFILLNNGVLINKQDQSNVKYFGIFDDLTNSFVLIYQMFFIYFASAKFLSYIGKKMREFEARRIDDNFNFQKSIKILRVVTLIVSIFVGFVAGAFFIVNAYHASESKNMIVYWYSCIGAGIWYYGLLICYVLSMSIHFFLSIIVYMFIICSYRKRIKTNDDKTIDILKILKSLKSSCTLCVFFGIYSLISVATVFLSDYRASKNYEVEFALAGYSGGIILIISLFLAALYFGSIYIARYYIIYYYSDPLMIFDKQKFPLNIDYTKFLVFIVTTILPTIVPWLQTLLKYLLK